MKLNCKPGDLAVGTYQPIFVGRICQVLRLAPIGYRDSSGHWNPARDSMRDTWGPMWIVDWASPFSLGDGLVAHKDCLIYDAFLRPLLPPAGTVSDDEVAELYEPSTKRTPEIAQ